MDIASHVSNMQRTNKPPSRANLEELIVRYKLYNSGVDAEEARVLSRTPHCKRHFLRKNTFQHLKDRANRMLPREEQLCGKRQLKGIAKFEAASCTPAIIRDQWLGLKETLRTHGLLDEKENIINGCQ